MVPRNCRCYTNKISFAWMDTPVKSCDNEFMATHEKLVRRFKVYQPDGTLLDTVEIVYCEKGFGRYKTQCESSNRVYHARHLTRALQAAEFYHLSKARGDGLIVRQVLL